MILDILFIYSISLLMTFFVFTLQRTLLSKELLRKLKEKNKELYELMKKQKVKEKEIERLYKELNDLHLKIFPRQMFYMFSILTVFYLIFHGLKIIYGNSIIIPLPIYFRFFFIKIEGGLGILGSYILFSLINGLLVRWIEKKFFAEEE